MMKHRLQRLGLAFWEGVAPRQFAWPCIQGGANPDYVGNTALAKRTCGWLVVAAICGLPLSGWAQPTPYSTHRPGAAGADPLELPRDLTGRSVKTPRIRAVHGSVVPGSSGWLIKNDPWLAYQMGRDLGLREFSHADGVFGDSGRLGGKVLDDQATPIMSRDHINACVGCHNVPWRDMGAGTTIQKNSGAGRNTPHSFGGGIVEMIGQEIRQQLLAQADINHNGWIELSEAHGQASVKPSPGEAPVDYGSFGDQNEDGRPDLNSIVYVWYLDKDGKRIPWARNLKAEGVAGYNFEVHVFGHGQRDRIGHGGLHSTLRAVSANAWDMHSGLQAHDPTANSEVHKDGRCKTSIAGAQQFYTGFTRDLGLVLSPSGVSLDDPDRDGVVEEISEGDMDLLEFYMLNLPRPAEKSDARSSAGKKIFGAIGCNDCHRRSWEISNDRRFFDVTTQWNDGRLTAKVEKLSGGKRQIDGVYSDFRHHDLGPDFYETQYDGSQTVRFRSAPLWGVGSTAPYGHDGASLSLEDVIVRHGGEARTSQQRYLGLSSKEQDDLLYFLRGLCLYSPETTACDINGDGKIDQHFMVGDRDTGPEVLNPEWLFRKPGIIEGLVQRADGSSMISRALVNLVQAYGLELKALVDRDENGFPDVFEPKKR